MDMLLIGDLALDTLDQQIERANLRLAWRMRFSGFPHGQLTPAQHGQLRAECLRVFGPRWQQEIGQDDCASDAITLSSTAQAAR
jgi:hypothetical protein